MREKAGLFNLTTGLTAVKFTQASHLLLQGLQCSAVLRLEEANRRRILPRGGRSSHIGVDDGTWSTHTTPCGIFFSHWGICSREPNPLLSSASPGSSLETNHDHRRLRRSKGAGEGWGGARGAELMQERGEAGGACATP